MPLLRAFVKFLEIVFVVPIHFSIVLLPMLIATFQPHKSTFKLPPLIFICSLILVVLLLLPSTFIVIFYFLLQRFSTFLHPWLILIFLLLIFTFQFQQVLQLLIFRLLTFQPNQLSLTFRFPVFKFPTFTFPNQQVV